MKDPVCPLKLALYGHPESGFYWEEHCDAKLKEKGFEIIEEWPGTYWHPKYRAMVIVYVDDFKVAAPSENMKKVWSLIREDIEMDEPTAPNTFLGCKHHLTKVPCADAPGGFIKVMEYDMEDQLQSAVDLYQEIVGTERSIK